jgi:ribonuclease R
LRRLVGASSAKAAAEFSQALRELTQHGTVMKRGKGRFGLPRDAEALVGIISVHPRGFGFVAIDGEDRDDVFIPPAKLGNAFSGDRVRIRLAEETDRGPAGIVEEVLERGHTTLTGEYSDSGPTPCIRPLRRDFPEEVELLCGRGDEVDEELDDGDWIVAELLYPDSPARPLRARFSRRLNAGTDLTEDMDAIVAEFALPPPYSEEQQSAAASLAQRQIERRDCSHLAAVTIDPVDAKDFDDAISIEGDPADGPVTVGVHIADVAAYVAPGSELDREARGRGFTAYLPGRTLPMLPKPLAADLCSLREGEPRPAHSVFLRIDASSGRVVGRDRSHTLLTVRKRLTFDDVQQAIEGSPPAHWAGDVAATIGRLATLAARMRANRTSRGAFLDMGTTEVRVVYEDDPPAIIGFKESRPNPAHELVEEFMLAANVAVAEELLEKSVPGVYRVHDTPKQSDVTEFRDWARNALGLRPGRMDSREGVNGFLQSVRGTRTEQLVLNAFLRALPRAQYSSKVAEHFGLGKDRYAHFTSPIRRYADLTVHQQLWLRDTGGELLPAEECEARAKEMTAIEMVNDEAYFAALDRVKIRYLNQRRAAGEKIVVEAIVSKATPDGLVVYMAEFGMMGFVPKDTLPADDYVFSARTSTLRGRHNDRLYRCGDPLRVRPHKADVARGQLQLRPA